MTTELVASMVRAIRLYLIAARGGFRRAAERGKAAAAAARPEIAAIDMAFTVDSAYQHGRGRGAMGKGRAQANV